MENLWGKMDPFPFSFPSPHEGPHWRGVVDGQGPEGGKLRPFQGGEGWEGPDDASPSPLLGLPRGSEFSRGAAKGGSGVTQDGNYL